MSASGRHGVRSVDGGDKGAADNECREGGRRKGKTLTGWYNRGEEEGVQDIDFCIMSYDVGVEKPHSEIFNAAVSTLDSLLSTEGNSFERNDWDLLYVGDEVAKDAKGAVNAGWDAVLLDRGAEVDAAYEGDAPGVEGVLEVEGKKVPVLKGFEALGTYGGHELLRIP